LREEPARPAVLEREVRGRVVATVIGAQLDLRTPERFRNPDL
jgi:hypothetical protein